MTLTIEATGSEPLPNATLVSVGDWRAADAMKYETRLHAEADSLGKRVFRDVPRGARIRLVAAGSRTQYEGREQIVDVGSVDLTLKWPPR